jgi:probable F420-dependent oxidoreductase
MKFSTVINTLVQAQVDSKHLEELGYDALFTNESKHDPFLVAALTADRTSKAEIMTYIAVAFARTPMVVAHSAHDLSALSKGRFTLGLGSQIKPHITRRFSMPWSHPAPRMKEFVHALHAIWDCWYDEKPLKFEGQFYTHTLTSPMFIPEDKKFGRPAVMLAAVGPEMTKVAAEVADGLLCHSFTTERYLREVTVPTIQHVLAEKGRARDKFRLVGMPYIAMGETAEGLEKAILAVKRTIAFYASTPAYKPVLDLHGWGELQPEMLRLSKLGRWQDMGALVGDDILNCFCVVGNAAACARELRRRFNGIFDLTGGYTGGEPGLPVEVLSHLKEQTEGAQNG